MEPAISENIIQAILETRKEIQTLIHRQHHVEAQRHRLSLEQYHLLLELDELALDVPQEDDSLTIGGIARRTGSAQNTISERITRLEERGLVQRERDARDRRVSRVALTPAGEELIEAIGNDAGKSLLTDALAALKDDDLLRLEEIVRKIHHTIQEKVSQ